MDAIFDLTLKQLDGTDPLQPTANNPVRSGVDVNTLMQMLNPPNAQTFPDSSFNNPALILINSLFSNQNKPLLSSFLESKTQSNPTELQSPPRKKHCVASQNSALPSVVPISPTHSASTSSCGSASSAQNSPIPWPSQSTSLLPRKTQRKPPAPIPDDKKDEAYYERRKKNNDAAKRSRDARRLKEEHTANLAAKLEKENLTLRNQIAVLKSELAVSRAEVAKIQSLLLSTSSILKTETSD
ncbi:Cell death specification protein 2 [Aphelenchoides besseyi]|nr:Cell death specification protein 2 [Aphelenchoides besseyi]KAI6207477.1 Cell death specification protein 2 [Aphelenchoides besseyi]